MKRIDEGSGEKIKKSTKREREREKEKRQEKKERGASRILCHLRCGGSLAYYATESVLFFLSHSFSLSTFLSSSFNSLAFSSDGESFVLCADSSEFSWTLSRPRRKCNDALENKRKRKMKIEIERERERRKGEGGIDTHIPNEHMS